MRLQVIDSDLDGGDLAGQTVIDFVDGLKVLRCTARRLSSRSGR